MMEEYGVGSGPTGPPAVAIGHDDLTPPRYLQELIDRFGIRKPYPPIIIITETLIVKMLLYGHSIAGEKVGCKGQELWSGESTTSLNHVRHLQRNRSCSNPPK